MSASAQSLESSQKVPSLNGHSFIPTLHVEDPFLRSYLLTNVGAGITERIKLPPLEVDGDTLLSERTDFLIALLDFAYQQRFKPWLATSIQFSAVSRLSTDAYGLVSAGAEFGTRLKIGWLLGVLRQKSSALSLYLGVERASITVINPAAFLEDVLDGKPAQFSDPIPSTQVEGSLRFAHGFSRLLGLKLETSLLYGEQALERDPGMRLDWQLGGSVSIDAWHIVKAPVGALVSYSISTFSEGVERSGPQTHQIELKLDYTVPKDYRLGIAFAWWSNPTNSERSISWFTAKIMSRFYL